MIQSRGIMKAKWKIIYMKQNDKPVFSIDKQNDNIIDKPVFSIEMQQYTYIDSYDR